MEKSRRAAREGPANPGAGNAASSRLTSGNPSPAPSPGRNGGGGGGHASNGVNSMDGGRRTANVARSSSRDRRRKRQHRRSR